MSVRFVARAGAVVGTAALAVGLLGAPTQARTVVTTEDVIVGLWYDDVVTGDGVNTLILYSGASVVDECTGDYPTATNRIRVHGDAPEEGATEVRQYVTRVPLHLYDGQGLDAAEYIAEVCGTLAAGGDEPTPVATGTGTVRDRLDITYNGEAAPPHVTDANSVVGVLRTADGDTWSVRGEAELTLSPDFVVEHVDLEIRNAR